MRTNDLMNQQLATLVAATLAAAISLLTLLVTILANRASEARQAQREVILPLLNRFGERIHETTALSNLVLKAESNEAAVKWLHQAMGAASELKKLRRKVRYSLWGLDKGIRALTRLPDWIGHMRSYPKSSAKLFKKGAQLGEAVDSAARRSYLFGRPPRIWERWIVNWRRRQFRSYYKKLLNTPASERK